MCCSGGGFNRLPPEYLKQPNRCKLYQHNPVDALGENGKGYKPRPKIIKITPDMDIAQIALAIFGETERI